VCPILGQVMVHVVCLIICSILRLRSVCGDAFVPADLLVIGFSSLGLGRVLGVDCMEVFSCSFVGTKGRVGAAMFRLIAAHIQLSGDNKVRDS
jgi:hypothetical protein